MNDSQEVSDGEVLPPNSAQEIIPIQDLSLEEKTFSNLVARGFTLSGAYRKAFPTAKSLSNYTIRKYASSLYSKSNIKTEVTVKQEKLARLARLSEDRIEEVLTEGNIHDKDDKVQDVAMFMYEQSNGKAQQNVNMTSTSVNLTIDMSAQQA